MRPARIWLMAVVVVTGADAAVRNAVGQEARPADSPKGNWGRVTPIADGNHPNLYYNQSEIDELRKMMLVQHAPKHLYDRYKAEIRDSVAVKTIPDNKEPHYKRAIQSRTEIDRRPGNKFGHPVIGYSQELWPGYRRYADRALEGAVSSLTDSKTDELELPAAIWEFFGHPRRIVWPVRTDPR